MANQAGEFRVGLYLFVHANSLNNIDPIVSLFSWKNGMRPETDRTLERLSVFPKSIYCFEPLEMMNLHYQGYEEIAMYAPHLRDSVRRYFPLFWDNSDTWVAIDLEDHDYSRVMLIDFQSAEPQELYPGFENFLEDAIEANKNLRALKCFGVN